MDEAPDYGAMSRRDLEDVARNIDREAFPERFALVREELRRRTSEPREQRNVSDSVRRLVAAAQCAGATSAFVVLIQTHSAMRFVVALLLLLDVVATFELWEGTQRGYVLSLILQAVQTINITFSDFNFVVQNGFVALFTIDFRDGLRFGSALGFTTALSLRLTESSKSEISINVVAAAATAWLITQLAKGKTVENKSHRW